jgi:8-oxo-dGTP diphosphatase
MQVSTLCYVRRGGRTLMLHRTKKDRDVHKGKWNGLGGKLESGESPEECVAREVREESGLTIYSPKLRGVMTFPEFKDREDWLVFLFTAEQFDGEMTESHEGRLEWINDAEIFNLCLWEGDKYFLRWLEHPRFFSAKFCYQDGALIKHEVTFYD